MRSVLGRYSGAGGQSASAIWGSSEAPPGSRWHSDLRDPAKVPGDLRSYPSFGPFHLPRSGPFCGSESPRPLPGREVLVSRSMHPPPLLRFKERDLAKPLWPIHTPGDDLIQGPSVSSEVHPTKARRGPLALWPPGSWSSDAKFPQQGSSLKPVGLLGRARVPATQATLGSVIRCVQGSLTQTQPPRSPRGSWVPLGRRL